ncbi:MAG: LysR family transcriptional regulator [Granulosicoccus sp.]
MSSNKWNWDHLRFFLALADRVTLSAAGRELGVSHTTVLRRVKAFESSLQTRLFEHTSAGYVLTAAGSSLLAHASKLKRSLDAAACDITRADHDMAGEILIATTDSLAFNLMPPLVRELTELYPELKLKIQMGSRARNMQNREADIAIRTCKEPPDNLVGRQLGYVKFSACASRDYIQRHSLDGFPRSTDNNQFIVLDRSFEGVPFYEWMRERIGAMTRTVEVNNFLIAKAMCSAGVGITVLPSYMLDDESGLQELSAGQPIAQNSLWMLTHSDLRDTARMRVVRQFLYDALSKQFQQDDNDLLQPL